MVIKIIMAADHEVKIGTTHRTVVWGWVPGDCIDQPLVIIREATRQEWIQSCIELCGKCKDPNNSELTHFYEVLANVKIQFTRFQQTNAKNN